MSSNGALVLAPVVAQGSDITASAGTARLVPIRASGSGLTGSAVDTHVTLGNIYTSGTLVTGNYGAGAAIIAAPRAAGGDSATNILLPAITAAGSGLVGNLAFVASRLQPIVAAGAGSLHGLAAGEPELVAFRASGSGYSGLYGEGAPQLLSPAASGTLLAGVIGTATIAIPAIRADGAGTYALVGSAAIALPVIRASGIGFQSAASSLAYVLNLQGNRLTEYTNYGFNSMAAFNGLYIAADGGGIYTLEGDDDDGTAIAARVRTGITDFGSPLAKRVERAWVGYRADGALELKVVTAGDVVATYALPDNGRDDSHNQGVKIGQGLKSRYWQFEIANVAGADFDFDSIEAMPRITPLRHNG